jgi:hypothetical protein
VGWLSRALGDVHPDDAPIGHAPGHDPDKVLMIGSGPAFGWGVTTHEVALCGALARAISSRTSRGCDIDLLTKSDFVARETPELVTARRLDRYDAIVFVLGLTDAIRGTSARTWRTTMGGLIERTLGSATDMQDIFFIGMPPIRSIAIYDTFLGGVAERHGAALNLITKELCAKDSRTTYIPLPGQKAALSEPGRHRTAAQYEEWADILAPTMATRLSSQVTVKGDRRKPTSQTDESRRQATVDELPVSDIATSATLRKLVKLAQRAFRVETAMFTIIDQQRQLHVISVGIELPEVSRKHSFCNVALQQREPLIVRDATTDEQFQNNPLVTGDAHIRFYAGIPITAPSGERVGALCVMDSQPRNRKDDIHLNYFRELTVLVEKELWKILNPTQA